MTDVELRLEGMELAAQLVENMPRRIQFNAEEQHILHLAAAEIRRDTKRFLESVIEESHP